MKKLLIIPFLFWTNFVLSQILATGNFNTSDISLGGLEPNLQTGAGPAWNTNRPYSCFMVGTDSIGVYARRSEVRLTDTPVNGKHRSEVGTVWTQPIAQNGYWYEIEFDTPTWQVNNSKRESWFQINDSTSGGGNEMSFELNDGVFTVFNFYNPNGSSNLYRRYDVGAYTPGERVNFVIFYYPSINGDGQIAIYKNGIQVTLTNGRNQNRVALPDVTTIWGPNTTARVLPNGQLWAQKRMYWKDGLYCYGINDADPATFVKRVLYVTKFRIGGINSTIATFFPPQPRPTNPDKIKLRIRNAN